MTNEEVLKEFKAKFKERTGLDLDTCTDEEYNKWYHDEYAKDAGTYRKEILRFSEGIIEKKDYSTLTSMLENYDQLVKSQLSREGLTAYPFWCYCFGDNCIIEGEYN